MIDLEHLARLPAARVHGGPGGEHRPPLAPARGRRVVVRQRRLRHRDAAEPGARRDAARRRQALRAARRRRPGRDRPHLDARRPRGRCASTSTATRSPALEAPIAALLRGDVAPFVAPLAHVTARGYNLYFPFPFARRCLVTVDDIVVARSVHRPADRRSSTTRSATGAIAPSGAARVRPYLGRRAGARRADASRASRRVLRDGPPAPPPGPAARTVAIAAGDGRARPPVGHDRSPRPPGGGEIRELRIATRERDAAEAAVDAADDRVRRRDDRRRAADRLLRHRARPGTPTARCRSRSRATDLLICRFRMPFAKRAVVTIARARSRRDRRRGHGRRRRRRRSARTACCFTPAGGRARSSARGRSATGTSPRIEGDGHQVGHAAERREPARRGLVGRRRREDLRRRRGLPQPVRHRHRGLLRLRLVDARTLRARLPRADRDRRRRLRRPLLDEPVSRPRPDPVLARAALRPRDLALAGHVDRRRRDRLLVRAPGRQATTFSRRRDRPRGPPPGRRPR